jgi:hypothetical protein
MLAISPPYVSQLPKILDPRGLTNLKPPWPVTGLAFLLYISCDSLHKKLPGLYGYQNETMCRLYWRPLLAGFAAPPTFKLECDSKDIKN